ncbi:protein arginine kinase [Ectobacillus sp. JY-23]|uniref:protein arginine kinase n=1 Tax=Ectobacillus sp. JY-23 TaxID=2933872 RepID=UPI001FF1531C|nr:protein arginine kinase [Ectobacillus sp. JY-23]UOY91449.1 protein arginine kinase [Ectobacillus sp. JY-23]
MSLDRIMNEAISPWMKEHGPEEDIVLSSRVRLARNLKRYTFPAFLSEDGALKVLNELQGILQDKDAKIGKLQSIRMDELQPLQRRVLVEKHLISPDLAEAPFAGACLLSENEQISVMINEEDHIRIQCLFPGLQLKEALDLANSVDDLLESNVEYAFDEHLGYLTSCPTNVGTGLRASVMMHLPGLVLTGQMSRIVTAINKLGLVVRGIYGEGSDALGNIFQISNQTTLGKSENDIIEDLRSVVLQIIEQERASRDAIARASGIRLEDKIYRSYGVLANCRLIESAEAASCLSDVRLGIDLGYIKHLSGNILTELMILTQPGILQQYAGFPLRPEERDQRRASLIRERLQFEENKNM